ncbi:MAG: hypothetical protein WCG22_07230, partial [Lentisphaerota bacterium]
MEKKIAPCLGCYHCWVVTPGQCVHHDDMQELLREWPHLVHDAVASHAVDKRARARDRRGVARSERRGERRGGVYLNRIDLHVWAQGARRRSDSNGETAAAVGNENGVDVSRERFKQFDGDGAVTGHHRRIGAWNP